VDDVGGVRCCHGLTVDSDTDAGGGGPRVALLASRVPSLVPPLSQRQFTEL
jgi:hypothetical protein